LAPGVELQISAEEAGMSPEQLRALMKELISVTSKVLKRNGDPS
jgi:hypothetical protein